MPALLRKVTLELDAPRQIFYDMKVLFQYEDEAKKSIKEFDISNAHDVCCMLTVMLRRTDPTITLDRVTELIHGQNWFEVQKGLAKVMGLVLLDGKGNKIDLGDEEKNPS
jgi:hypothetical protein